MTEKLYWADATALAFETTGAVLSTHDDRTSIVLPRTLFYPEGGGQLGDAGTLAIGEVELSVVDTQIDGDGAIHHVLGAPLQGELAARFREGAAAALPVRGSLDRARRRDHMAQHTAQHALSRALADRAKADTVSARLGASLCTIDVNRPGIANQDLHQAEDLVNAIVMDDVAVTTSFPSAEELATLSLRKQPNAEKSAKGVRVVTIEGFDVTPCGGTHCTRTGQIGQVRIVGTEKYKGMLRVSFHGGARALSDARFRHQALLEISTELTCGPHDALGAVLKLRAEAKGAREKLDGARAELAELLAQRVREALPQAPGPHVVHLARPHDDLAALRVLAGKLTEDARVVALVGGHDPGSGETVLVVQRGAGGKLDCGAFVSAEGKARGGRGGGRPERAEGRFPRGTSIEVLATAASVALANSLPS
ncbi:MAG: alanyl-tRNA editing protein [Labilithrix sp.]|nr:alanyl-tRNA editing protein [Labilithrix sp.]